MGLSRSGQGCFRSEASERRGVVLVEVSCAHAWGCCRRLLRGWIGSEGEGNGLRGSVRPRRAFRKERELGRAGRWLLVSVVCAAPIAWNHVRVRRLRTRCPQAALHFLVPGTSSGSISPHFFQPVDSNHDRAIATSRGSGLSSPPGASTRHPSNQRPEEAASIRTGGACPRHSRQCLRALRSTYAIALRTSRGVSSTRR